MMIDVETTVLWRPTGPEEPALVRQLEFLRRYPVQQAGGRTILELWVPADEFNEHIAGLIEVVHEFR